MHRHSEGKTGKTVVVVIVVGHFMGAFSRKVGFVRGNEERKVWGNVERRKVEDESGKKVGIWKETHTC